jgi:hypothetical protein
MRLLEYRVSNSPTLDSNEVGRKIANFFKRQRDLALLAVINTRVTTSARAVTWLLEDDLEFAFEAAFRASFSRTMDPFCTASIRSALTCRFVVFELDGLIRVCHASSDEAIQFESNPYSVADATELLASTDMFDTF